MEAFFSNTKNAVSFGRPSPDLNRIQRLDGELNHVDVGTVHQNAIAYFLIALFDLSGLFKRDSKPWLPGYVGHRTDGYRSKVLTRLVPP